MRTRVPVPLPVLVLVGLVLLVLGFAGTATASGLTPKTVKKIAAKAIAKAAPRLSVSHATTADTASNATNLGGQPADQYKNPTYRFVLPIQAAAGSRTYTFPGVPAGSYLVGYNVFTNNTGSNTETVCQMRANASAAWEVFSGSSRYGTLNTTTHATAVLQLTSAPPVLYCSIQGSTFSIYSDTNFLSTVTFTRVDGITNGTPTATRADRDGPALTQNP